MDAWEEAVRWWIAQEPEIQAAIIGVAGAVIGGLAGGCIAGYFTVAATNRAHRQTLERDDRLLKSTTHSLLLALRAEIETIAKAYNKNIGPTIRSLRQGEPLLETYALGSGYFTIYEANAERIGNVRDHALRAAIVVTYTAARSMLDSIGVNDQLNARLERVRLEHAMAPGNQKNAALGVGKDAYASLVAYAAVLKDQDAELMKYVDDLLSRLPS